MNVAAMTYSETSVASSSSGSESLVVRPSVGEPGASALAAWRTSCESSALPGFGHDATLAAMSGVIPVCASLSLSAAQRRSTLPVRESVRITSSFPPAPQPPSAASPSAEQRSLPLAAEPSAAPAFARRFAPTSQCCRKSERTPNNALQRTVPRVTAHASHRRSHPCRLSPTHGPRRAPRSLSLGSLGVSASLP